jgi:hypothetical protein
LSQAVLYIFLSTVPPKIRDIHTVPTHTGDLVLQHFFLDDHAPIKVPALTLATLLAVWLPPSRPVIVRA